MAKPEYRSTMFDRGGPEAGDMVRLWAYGLMIFGLVTGAFLLQGGFTWWVVPAAAGAALLGVGGAAALSAAVGTSAKHLMSGATTPYVEQYSYQQTLVMRGEVDAALESFEAVIAERPENVTARVKAAELYARETKNHVRAVALFREIQRVPDVSAGEYIYATNRLVDLLSGPVGDAGRARVELRKLIERFPGSPTAANARAALAELRARESA